ncbi:TatD family hydrolase [bacterium]|nr:TatD family hydrolase [bacterium]
MISKPVWVDSHCHLEMLKEDLDVVMDKNQETGTTYCVTIGTSHKSNTLIQQLLQDYPNLYGTFGFHPHGASAVQESHYDWIKDNLESNHKIVAIGECGYDLFYEYSDRSTQATVFERQLFLASEMNMPVVIHSRDADSLTCEMLDLFKGKALTGVVHCFTSDLSQAKYLLDYGFYLSFNGICTFPQAETVREVLKYVPMDRILLETDSPFLSPVPYRGKPNYPGRVSIVGEFVADLLGISTVQLANQVLNNTRTLFPRFNYEN